jgi:nucleoside-diphosphate-sugar epimerase
VAEKWNKPVSFDPDIAFADRAPRLIDADSFATDLIYGVLLPEYAKQLPHAPIALIASPSNFTRTIQAINDRRCHRFIERTKLRVEFREHVQALLCLTRRLAALRTLIGPTPKQHLFVTGATGFLGMEFVHEVLRSTSYRITVLCRSTKDATSADRLPFSVEDYMDRLRIVDGDIRLQRLGLSDEAYRGIVHSVTDIWHFAAVTAFDDSNADLVNSVNIDGTDRTLELAKKMKKLRFFNHISTAYVAGRDPGPIAIPERIEPDPPSFNNAYEASKYEAERRVARSGLPYLIYRPAIVMGESVSGRSDDQTVYSIAKAVRTALLLGERDAHRRKASTENDTFRVVADPDALKNFIPVEEVVSMCLRLRAAEPPMGSIFHVTNPTPTHVSDLVKALADLLKPDHYAIVDSLEGETLSVPEKVLARYGRVFEPYMKGNDPTFDRTNVTATLGSVQLPSIDRAWLRSSIDLFYKQTFGLGYANQSTSGPAQNLAAE